MINNSNIATTSYFALIILLVPPLTTVLSFFLLWLYRRSVLRGMKKASDYCDVEVSPAVSNADPLWSDPVLTVVTVDHKAPQASNQESAMLEQDIRSALRRVVVVYSIAGLIFALIFAIEFLVFMTKIGTSFLLLPTYMPWLQIYPSRFLFYLWWYFWPTVIVINVFATLRRRERVRNIAIYFASCIPIAYFASRSGVYTSLLIVLWLMINGIGTLMLWAFSRRRVRAVGPLVLALSFAAVSGLTLLMIFITAMADQEDLLLSYFYLTAPIGLDFYGHLLIWSVIVLIIFSAAGLWLLRLLGRKYQRKKISDQTITADAVYLTFALLNVQLFVVWSWLSILVSVMAFIAYKACVRLCTRYILGQSKSDKRGNTMLLLRVFSLGKRSEALYDILSQRWRYLGDITLIAGPDLATSTVEPHEFLAFLGGKLPRQFVQDATDLDQRINSIDAQEDPDGRYRVNEFFCLNNTWKMTMRRLASRSDIILMDLRSFSHTNSGCLYELGQLLQYVSLKKVLFLIDDTTSRPFLEEQMQKLWRHTSNESPNRQLPSAEIHLFHVSKSVGVDTQALLSLLYGIVTAT